MVRRAFHLLVIGSFLISFTSIYLTYRQTNALLDSINEENALPVPVHVPVISSDIILDLPSKAPTPEVNYGTKAMLTIVTDRRGGCPDKCMLLTSRLPPWVIYRYYDFKEVEDLELSDDNSTHMLIIARTNIVNLAAMARRRKQRLPHLSIGLFHNADERIFAGEINKPYRPFDYVIRNYYGQSKKAFGSMTLRALGNHTCGTSAPLPTTKRREPRYGVHWVHLDSHGLSIHMLRSAASIWPTSRRTRNCSFSGRKDEPRMRHQRHDMQVALGNMCNITLTKGFGVGKSYYEYFEKELAMTKIGLAPRGTAAETHRLAEILRMGAVPAILDEPYLHKAFRDVPGIIGRDWQDVATKIRYYLEQAPEALEALGRQAAKFAQDYEQCAIQDMDVILKGAFGIQKPIPPIRPI